MSNVNSAVIFEGVFNELLRDETLHRVRFDLPIKYGTFFDAHYQAALLRRLEQEDDPKKAALFIVDGHEALLGREPNTEEAKKVLETYAKPSIQGPKVFDRVGRALNYLAKGGRFNDIREAQANDRAETDLHLDRYEAVRSALGDNRSLYIEVDRLYQIWNSLQHTLQEVCREQTLNILHHGKGQRQAEDSLIKNPPAKITVDFNHCVEGRQGIRLLFENAAEAENIGRLLAKLKHPEGIVQDQAGKASFGGMEHAKSDAAEKRGELGADVGIQTTMMNLVRFSEHAHIKAWEQEETLNLAVEVFIPFEPST